MFSEGENNRKTKTPLTCFFPPFVKSSFWTWQISRQNQNSTKCWCHEFLKYKDKWIILALKCLNKSYEMGETAQGPPFVKFNPWPPLLPLKRRYSCGGFVKRLYLVFSEQICLVVLTKRKTDCYFSQGQEFQLLKI